MYKKCIAIVLFAATQIFGERCNTPNGEEAECISLYSCLRLVGAIVTQDEEAIEFVRRSHCGFNIDPLVCCGSEIKFLNTSFESKHGNESVAADFLNLQIDVNNPNVSQNPINISQTANTAKPKRILIPDRRFCGLQHTDDYVYTGNTTAINEFPWVVLLRYLHKNVTDVGFKCAGSLVSNRYVLTAAQCIVEDLATELTVISVRLGEHNINKDVDCVDDPQFPECSDPVLDLGIEEIIPHPEYRHHKNDIGLLRLNMTITYSDFVRPICLPFAETTTFAKVGEFLISSGWGQSSLVANYTTLKKRVQNQIISNAECEAELNKWRKVITENHLCTIYGSTKEYVCRGDSGGPLMFSHRHQWHIEGVISTGGGCGDDSKLVCTRVSKYVNWIKDNIRS